MFPQLAALLSPSHNRVRSKSSRFRQKPATQPQVPRKHTRYIVHSTYILHTLPLSGSDSPAATLDGRTVETRATRLRPDRTRDQNHGIPSSTWCRNPNNRRTGHGIADQISQTPARQLLWFLGCPLGTADANLPTLAFLYRPDCARPRSHPPMVTLKRPRKDHSSTSQVFRNVGDEVTISGQRTWGWWRDQP